MMSTKERIDVRLVQEGFFPSREKARAAIMAGLVFVGQERCDKAGMKVETNKPITVKGQVHPYVSRGGLKLEKAIQAFDIDLKDAVVMDIGASTGGFTDCALQHGARLVYAIDVGYGQLDWSLRQNENVVVMERTNFRHLKVEEWSGEKIQFATIDVSFISLRLILPVLKDFLKPGARVLALVKPQFEAGREQVGKHGVVRDPNVHEEVLRMMTEFSEELGFIVRGLSFSPITGGEGNIEFLLHLEWSEDPATSARLDHEADIARVVHEAHATF
ncbi:TlyA family RNA methyltransferase [Aneurinibacillus migulanus]|nr:TlyA family RNA methyltransferase [Aneurinibacillus migulanus]MCP1355775.1 TlyA family RNA methyltransferase [Aneurinibacillus migulanus]MED0891654.1 TlyA family RNA methyltransferase [Aneurinibacillus migulanus]MED1617606.1 TlyA family RNA methyltransferase [Aneurinibacillus migulanus]MED4726582.1 TlyA family RNA methyltransferase [Aneurinibacillus migulanus]